MKAQRVSLTALTAWVLERTADPRLPVLKLEGPAGTVKFWVVEVPQDNHSLAIPPGVWPDTDAYVRSVTCAQVDLLARGYAFESATEEHPDPDRGRRIALQRALEALGAPRQDRVPLWAAYEALCGSRGSKRSGRRVEGPIESPRVVCRDEAFL